MRGVIGGGKSKLWANSAGSPPELAQVLEFKGWGEGSLNETPRDEKRELSTPLVICILP
jgi:hypothetical protein